MAASEDNPVSRRYWMHRLAAAFLAGSATNAAWAQHVHRRASAAARKGPYRPRYLSPREFAAVERLCELILPPDAVSGSARDAGAGAFIDLLCASQRVLGEAYRDGLAWLEAEMRSRFGKGFLDSSAVEQQQLLGMLANSDPALAAGRRFWTLLRRMVVDAFYTSPIGIRDLGFVGNTSVMKYVVPPQVLEYALRKSPFFRTSTSGLGEAL